MYKNKNENEKSEDPETNGNRLKERRQSTNNPIYLPYNPPHPLISTPHHQRKIRILLLTLTFLSLWKLQPPHPLE